MGLEQGRGEQYDPAEFAIAEQQGPVDLTHEALIRRAVVEDAGKPPTHPLRRGGWLRPATGNTAVMMGSKLGQL